ncbi:MAG: DUF2058 domain-containing protein [Methylococcales bacterium]|nr:DUF2058 domain-containing protein [Methylococcales bacterium]
MSKKLSMQEQLLKAGLVSSAKAKTIKTEKHKQQHAQRHHKVEVIDEAKMWAEKAAAEKAERDQLLNLQLQEQARQKEIKAQIKQLVEEHKIEFDRKNAEIAYRFTDGTTVKTLYVDENLRNQLVKGTLAIVKFGKDYELVNVETALKIKERDAKRVLVLNEAKKEEIAADDPYAAFEIPDDLMW